MERHLDPDSFVRPPGGLSLGLVSVSRQPEDVGELVRVWFFETATAAQAHYADCLAVSLREEAGFEEFHGLLARTKRIHVRLGHGTVTMDAVWLQQPTSAPSLAEKLPRVTPREAE